MNVPLLIVFSVIFLLLAFAAGIFYLLRKLRRLRKTRENTYHDIRSALSPIMGFVEILLKKDLDKEKRADYLREIYEAAKRINVIIK